MTTGNAENTSVQLSIIIISYNTRQITFNCLESIFNSLYRSKLNFEIIVVDNASNDGSVAMLKSYQLIHKRQLRLIINPINIGFGKANNQAAKEARGDYLLFLNSDIIVQNNAIEKLINFYSKNKPHIHFVGGKLLNADYTPQPSCGPFFSLPAIFAALFLKGDYWGLTRYSPKHTKKVDWVSGACLLATKELFFQVGGFDEKIFMYMEEVDLLYRAKKIGLKTFIYPKAQFIHLGSASSSKKSYPIIQVFSGLIYFYKKHRSPLALFLLRFMLQLKALIALIIGKLTNNTYLAETYAKAYQITTHPRQ